MLDQAKVINIDIFKKIIGIFNSIWSVFPVLEKNWSQQLLATLHPKHDYLKCMRVFKANKVQEYQFYKLYENMTSYALEYFELLKTAMN